MQVCLAQQAVEPWKAPPFSVEPKALYEAASAAPAPDGTNVAVLVHDDSYTFDETGRLAHWGMLSARFLPRRRGGMGLSLGGVGTLT